MPNSLVLTITSLRSIPLMTFHLADDVRGMEPGGVRNLIGVLIANSSGMFFWVRTLLALGVTGIFSAILSARGLWSLRTRQSR